MVQGSGRKRPLDFAAHDALNRCSSRTLSFRIPPTPLVLSGSASNPPFERLAVSVHALWHFGFGRAHAGTGYLGIHSCDHVGPASRGPDGDQRAGKLARGSENVDD